MLARGEYGEFFPLKFSPYAYNNSFACLIFALSETQVGSFGANWYDETKDDLSYQKQDMLQPEEIPANIDAIEDDMLKKVLICKVTKRPFRITADELEFYRRKRLPLPTAHPNERIKNRYILANPYRLYDESCGRCGTPIKVCTKRKTVSTLIAKNVIGQKSPERQPSVERGCTERAERMCQFEIGL